jgi:hypothetical protein
MELTTSLAANRPATRRIPKILWNPKVHYSINKSPPLVFIMGHMKPVHITPSDFSKIHFNIILPLRSKYVISEQTGW